MLSYFVVMKQKLEIPDRRQGFIVKAVSRLNMNSPHRHSELEFNVVLRGKASYLLDNRRYFLSSDTIVWLFPQQEHMLLDCSNDFEMWVAVFRPELLRQVCRLPSYQILLNENPPGYFCKQIGTSQTENLHQLLSTLSKTDQDETLFNTGLAYVLTLAWSIHTEPTDIPPNADIHPAVENAVRILQKNSRLDTLDALALQAGLSPARLSRLFKQQIGVSVVQFKNRLRVERFVQIYQKGRRKNMMQAALDAGFGSYPQFYREFVRVMGCTPACFRRQS